MLTLKEKFLIGKNTIFRYIFFIFFFWLIPYGLRLLISLVMKNPEVKIENAGTQAIADGMNNIVSLVANVAIYGLKIFAVVLLLISIFGAIRSYIRSR